MVEGNHTKNKMLGIRFYQHEFDEIKEMAEKLEISPSDFGREAIREKIERINNPRAIQVETETESNKNALQIEKIENILGTLINKVENLAEINSKMLEMQISFPSKLDEDINLDENISKITNAIKKNRESKKYKANKTLLTLEEIINSVNIDEDLVFDILYNSNKFEQPANKRGWDLNE